MYYLTTKTAVKTKLQISNTDKVLLHLVIGWQKGQPKYEKSLWYTV